jgi:magnesium-dependent phosphatase 1
MAASTSSAAGSADFPPFIVFDLDFTLWPLDVDSDVSPPFTTRAGAVYDKRGYRCSPFPDVPSILARCAASDTVVAIASRTHDPAAAEALLRELGWWDLLRLDAGRFQAHPSRGAQAKSGHFRDLFAATGFTAADTLFFDDMPDNIECTIEGGIASIFLGRDGLTLKAFEAGLAAWRSKK